MVSCLPEVYSNMACKMSSRKKSSLICLFSSALVRFINIGYFRCYCLFEVELFILIFIRLHSTKLPVRSGYFSSAVNAIVWCHWSFRFTLHDKIPLSLFSRIFWWPYWVHRGYHDHGRLGLEMNYMVLGNEQRWALAGEMERWGDLENNDAYGEHSLCSRLGRCWKLEILEAVSSRQHIYIRFYRPIAQQFGQRLRYNDAFCRSICTIILIHFSHKSALAFKS